MSKDLLEQLVYAYDLSILGYATTLDESLCTFDFTQEMLTTNVLPHRERASLVAMNSLYQKYVEQNPGGTKEEFAAKVLPFSIDVVTDYVQARIPETVPFQALKEFHRVQFLNLTRLNLDRQVKR